ncbi:sigma factor-like helix-turn-helix DNA-binding protein [Actinomycetospora sp. CA-101289]|uniref:sigma factor-like helix-turn-helix DNA-binding protein n=1 Tax=Actinomycetospora sp. CA-101289 TaxID=3239893 RepID=UPI003D985DD9
MAADDPAARDRLLAHERAEFWSLVFSIAARSTRNGQARIPEPRTSGSDGGDDGRASRMNELVDRLPDHERAVLLLRVQRALTTTETARILGSTPASVRVAEHRALVTIRRASAHESAAGRTSRSSP